MPEIGPMSYAEIGPMSVPRWPRSGRYWANIVWLSGFIVHNLCSMAMSRWAHTETIQPHSHLLGARSNALIPPALPSLDMSALRTDLLALRFPHPSADRRVPLPVGPPWHAGEGAPSVAHTSSGSEHNYGDLLRRSMAALL